MSGNAATVWMVGIGCATYLLNRYLDRVLPERRPRPELAEDRERMADR